MDKKIISVLLFFLIFLFSFGDNNKYIEIENILYGFTLDDSFTIEKQIGIMEKKVYGEVGEGSIEERENKLYNFLQDNIKNKLGESELIIFGKKSFDKSILDRIEKIEYGCFRKYNNKLNFLDRIKKIKKFLGNKNSEEKIFFSQEKELKKSMKNNKIELKLYRDFRKIKLKNGEIIKFILEEKIKGIAEKGSIIYGKVINVKKSLFFFYSELDIKLFKIINKDKKIYDINELIILKKEIKKLKRKKSINVKMFEMK
ncbi:hypothetical protein [Haliovirga abyssi]|uniref:Flagellar assembly protein T C-terminal domain-containing protein n=1 Tax=Haliovirga abyssi TaxID=2996794 RepID=A0AAU9E2Y2_9FUSO|nr:hypothetical protein [Haliovirga abyssi]BDU50775.1 hypothetical protein HLVA_13440 [Haliovirga abyssi]